MFKTKHQTINYAFDGSGWAYRPVETNTGKHRCAPGKIKTGDRLIMTLNIKDKTLIYHTHKHSEDEANMIEACKIKEIKTENIKYNLAVYLWRSGKITLTDFSIQ